MICELTTPVNTQKKKTSSLRLRLGPIFLLGLFIAFSGSRGAVAGALSCEDLFEPKVATASKVRFKIRPSLPERGSPEYVRLVESVRQQFASNSYAILNLESIFTKVLGEAWFLSMPHKVSSQILRQEFLFESPEGRKVEPVSRNHRESIAAIHGWFADIIQDAIPLRVRGGYTNVRLSTSTEKALNLDSWHEDGGTAVVTLSVLGPGTEILGVIPKEASKSKLPTTVGGNIDWPKVCVGCQPLIVPRGHAVIFMGSQDRSPNPIHPPTIHRTPLEFAERVLFVMRYD